MKIALSILKRYIPNQLSAEEIAQAFVQLGFEIEDTEILGYCGQGPLVVGCVQEKNKHPNADHLSVCKVNVGQNEPLQIVCGASNFKVGDYVPVALVNAKLGDVVIKKTNMRGFDSHGMMCSASELGLETGQSAGLYILNDLNPQVGTPLDELFADRKDVVFDIAITSNRGDCLSYLGLARELSAFTGLPVTLPEVNIDFDEPVNDLVSLNTDACDYYSGYLIENIQVAPSSQEIQDFLQKSGLNPINNVVDITNYILLELGQPLHAFDADKIQFPLCVRSANKDEILKTLDNRVHTLQEGDLVVADAHNALSIAGIMGGSTSQISSETHRIFIECAHFSVDTVRQTSRRLNVFSDSSYRFERFVDKENALYALKRAIQLLRKCQPDVTLKQFTAIGTTKTKARTLALDFKLVEKLLGFNASPTLFKSSLEKLNFQILEKSQNNWEITVPTYRDDITQWVDLVEEFVRICGTENIPSNLPVVIACNVEDSPVHELRNRHAAILSNAGFYECYTDTLEPTEWYHSFLPDSTLTHLTIERPLSQEHAVLRYSLVPGLVNCLQGNRYRGNPVERLFESGRIFKVNRDGALCEMFATAFIFCPSQQRQWLKTTPFNFYEGQSYVRSLITASGMPANCIQTATEGTIPLWQQHYAGRIGLWEQRGFEANLGYLNIDFTQHWFKNEIIFAAECMWLPERIRTKSSKIFKPYPECPTITKDLALWVPNSVLAEEVRQTLLKILKKLVKNPIQVEDVRVFDLFRDPQNTNNKSLAFSIVFSSNTGSTLTEAAVNPIFEALQVKIEENHIYQVRKQVL